MVEEGKEGEVGGETTTKTEEGAIKIRVEEYLEEKKNKGRNAHEI